MAAVNPFIQEPIPTGEVVLHTSVGDITIELWCREVPKACRNFLQLALEGYYDGCIFHRIVPDFIAQTGDPTGTGTGGESIYDEPFEDEINQRMKFNRRGLVAMANLGEPHTNTSQFFLTLDRTDALQGKHSIFGRVASDRTIFNLMKMNTLELEPGTDRPQYPPAIKSIEVVKQFFDDIKPRILASERKEQLAARKEARQRAKEAKGPKRKGAKNAALLSFGGDEIEEGGDPSLANVKFKSAHDVDETGRLSNQVADDRGLSAHLPASFADMPTTKRQKTETPAPVATESKPVKKPKIEKAPELSASEKIKAEIASVSDSLRKRRPSEEAEENGRKKAKKAAGPSALALERAKYAAKPVEKGKNKGASLDDLLSSFRSKVRSAAAIAPAMADSAAYEGEILEADEGDLDEEAGIAFLGHALKFRKDATQDLHKLDEYSVHDPLAKQKENFTLEDAKNEEDRRRRAGLVPGAGRDRDRGGKDRERDRRR